MRPRAGRCAPGEGRRAVWGESFPKDCGERISAGGERISQQPQTKIRREKISTRAGPNDAVFFQIFGSKHVEIAIESSRQVRYLKF